MRECIGALHGWQRTREVRISYTLHAHTEKHFFQNENKNSCAVYALDAAFLILLARGMLGQEL